MTKKLTKNVIVQNRSGMHARPCTMIVKESKNYQSDIKLRKENVVADCRSVLDLLSLGAAPSTELNLEVNGEDAEEALMAIAALFESRFSEDDLSDY